MSWLRKVPHPGQKHEFVGASGSSTSSPVAVASAPAWSSPVAGAVCRRGGVAGQMVESTSARTARASRRRAPSESDGAPAGGLLFFAYGRMAGRCLAMILTRGALLSAPRARLPPLRRPPVRPSLAPVDGIRPSEPTREQGEAHPEPSLASLAPSLATLTKKGWRRKPNKPFIVVS